MSLARLRKSTLFPLLGRLVKIQISFTSLRLVALSVPYSQQQLKWKKIIRIRSRKEQYDRLDYLLNFKDSKRDRSTTREF